MGYEEKQSVSWKDGCVESFYEKALKDAYRWTGRRDMIETLFKTAFNPNQLIIADDFIWNIMRNEKIVYDEKVFICLFNVFFLSI